MVRFGGVFGVVWCVIVRLVVVLLLLVVGCRVRISVVMG